MQDDVMIKVMEVDGRMGRTGSHGLYRKGEPGYNFFGSERLLKTDAPLFDPKR